MRQLGPRGSTIGADVIGAAVVVVVVVVVAIVGLIHSVVGCRKGLPPLSGTRVGTGRGWTKGPSVGMKKGFCGRSVTGLVMGRVQQTCTGLKAIA